GLDYFKILGVFVGDDKKKIVMVFDGVEEVIFARSDQRQLFVRLFRMQETDLAGEFTFNRNKNEFFIARFGYIEKKTFIFLLIDCSILIDATSQNMFEVSGEFTFNRNKNEFFIARFGYIEKKTFIFLLIDCSILIDATSQNMFERFV